MDEKKQEEILNQLQQELEEKKAISEKYDELIEEALDELWELKVRCIVCEELERTSYESACRSAGIVKAFYGNKENG